ncbi:MAG: hypothetical protein JNK04_12575 [Myxococcales bacterium]|nr:hypothetical protein [Myxococcales bacterium]
MAASHAVTDALVYAVAYLGVADCDDSREDQDVGALESIAAVLQEATSAEHDELAAAAERALSKERASVNPRKSFVAAYESFMEDLLGDPWQGNRRNPSSDDQ